MAKRKVERRARKILGEEPIALVWCALGKAIPTPPKDVHRAAGKGRLKGRHHWLLYVGAVLGFFIIVPWYLLDTLGSKPARGPRVRRTTDDGPRAATPSTTADREPAPSVFDGDWGLAAGQLLLRWYAQSPNPRRLVLLTQDRICVAASPRRRLSPTKADDFRIVTELGRHEARVEAERGQPRGFATFRIRFADGSWLELGKLADPDDADHFFHTVGE
ncbi:hypothetical protein [Streptomyces melanogenes]|uniref:Uncharacterized protein n=1 Tax=Streptomyces melanogenes TaxID=67326 RepID=A0ABZ1XGA5_9ACTN|nr:hypothetical protein [Streptomyces melanogenes]